MPLQRHGELPAQSSWRTPWACVLPAACYFKENATNKTLKVKIVNEAVSEFIAEHRQESYRRLGPP